MASITREQQLLTTQVGCGNVLNHRQPEVHCRSQSSASSCPSKPNYCSSEIDSFSFPPVYHGTNNTFLSLFRPCS